MPFLAFVNFVNMELPTEHLSAPLTDLEPIIKLWSPHLPDLPEGEKIKGSSSVDPSHSSETLSVFAEQARSWNTYPLYSLVAKYPANRITIFVLNVHSPISHTLPQSLLNQLTTMATRNLGYRHAAS